MILIYCFLFENVKKKNKYIVSNRILFIKNINLYI